MRNLFAILALVLLAVPAFGAPNTTHGQGCDDDITTTTKGIYNNADCINLCNNYAAADDGDACTEFQFTGLPHIIILEREENDANCSGDVTFTFTTGPDTGGRPDYALDTSAVVLNDTTERIVFVLDNGPMDIFLFTAVSNDTACTDVDVRMSLIYKKD